MRITMRQRSESDETSIETASEDEEVVIRKKYVPSIRQKILED